MKWCFVLLFANVLFAGDGPRLFFSRAFPGSLPPYFQVTLDQNGGAEYREAQDEDDPLKFHLAEAETREVFGLVEKLDYFKRPLESPARCTGASFLPGTSPWWTAFGTFCFEATGSPTWTAAR